MTNNVCRKTLRTALALACVPAAAAVFFLIAGLAAQEKSIPDHSSFTDCRMCHAEKYKMWETTIHSKSIPHATAAPPHGVPADADCFGCHTAEGFAARLNKGRVDPADRKNFQPITCVACHKPGSKANPKQLVRPPEKICDECHPQRTVLQGRGAKGVEDMRSFHSAVACVSCHMTDARHDMKLIRPDDPGLSEGRRDTCTLCHKDNNRSARAKQLTGWQASYKKAMEPIEADLAAISAALKAKPNLLNAAQKEKLNTVKSNLNIIQRDGSHGAHNIDFALYIMDLAAKDIKEIKAAIR